ncbi:MAG: RNA methyltransferase [Acidimicrobiales bacterium]
MPRIEIIDHEDPRIFQFQGLRDHTLRQKRELPGGEMASWFIAEGDLVVERALAAGYELDSILIDGKRTKPFGDAVGDDVPIYACAPNVLQHITGYHLHRGCVACFRRKPLLSVDDVLPDARNILVCEGIMNPTNMGVILRCAAGLGIDSFFLDPTCSDPLYRRSGRVSMGEAYALPYARLDAFPDGLDVLREAGVRLVALTPGDPGVPGRDALDIAELVVERDERVALLLGSEGPGLTAGTLETVHQRVRIPMSGTVDSINVGSAAAVAFYALQQARRAGER